MWRSKARNLLLLSSIRRFPRQSQVHLKSFNQGPSPSLKSSEWPPPPVGVRPRHCRLFSADSVTGGVGSSGEGSSEEDDHSEDDSVSEGSEFRSTDVLERKQKEDGVFCDNIDAVFGESVGPLSGSDDEVKGQIGGEESEASEWKEDGGPDEDTPEEASNSSVVLQSTTEEPLGLTFDKMDLTLSEEFVARVLQTPLTIAEKLIGFFRWASERPEYAVSSNSLDLLVRAIATSPECNKNEAYMLWDLIKEIGEKDKQLLTTEILNQLISLFGILEKAKAGLEVFNRFEEFGCKTNGDSYYLTIHALSKRRMLDTAWSVCEKMLNSGELPDAEKIGKVIAFLCKGKRAKDAYLIYLEAKEKGKCHRVLMLTSSWVALQEMMIQSTQPWNYSRTIQENHENVQEAKNLISRMIDSGPPPGNAVFNHVIGNLSKAGEMDDAVSLLRQMEGRGLRPDIYTYSVVMSGFAKGGMMDEARKIFNEAKARHPNLISTTYHILIRVIARWRKMKNDGLQPNADEYNKMVQSLCLKALDWRAAEKLLEEVKETGLHLNPMTQSLISAIKELEQEELKSAVAT
ncbi:unnamed protein product [Spirodela intermedia]|uniref:Uncharacterized protein n=1 Tax=Spirodela intermedia TaxID=51605 RepID=A0A7I8J179_SPIIN|nr:unnamed protein product [Spirodela intermedia]CAA6663887.1 unnamed protein product [Spirodela intermedia]